ncbi:MAG: fluoride efflux transporter CrcB [Rhizobacter sp.]|nr:fluoride efflux transporter CrcB [Ferruginibacter sp.]
MIRNFLLVAAGGAIGTMMRYATSLLLPVKNFPAATLFINIAGSFAIGIIMALSVRSVSHMSETTRLFLATGICGGFTTFSTFSYENMQLLQSGKYSLAFIYIIVSVVLGLAAVLAGFKLFNA